MGDDLNDIITKLWLVNLSSHISEAKKHTLTSVTYHCPLRHACCALQNKTQHCFIRFWRRLRLSPATKYLSTIILFFLSVHKHNRVDRRLQVSRDLPNSEPGQKYRATLHIIQSCLFVLNLHLPYLIMLSDVTTENN